MRLIITGKDGTPMQCWQLPADSNAFSEHWWRITDAAEAWGCVPTTAKRLIDRHPDAVRRQAVQVVTPRGSSLRTVIPAGMPRPSGLRGNPNWRKSEYEQALALRRWHPDAMRRTMSPRWPTTSMHRAADGGADNADQ